MSTSLTWQSLPEPLLEPVMAGVLLLHEAAELWDLSLTHSEEWIEPPEHLVAAAMRLNLFQMEREDSPLH